MLSASTIASLNEAYSSMYDEELYEEILSEELDIIESFVEEIVFELIDEGYDIEEIEESFDDELIEEIIIEAKVTYGHDTESPEERRARAKAKVGEKRSAARKAAVKGAIKAAGEKASAVKGAVKAKVKDTKQQSHVGLAKYASKRNLMRGPGLKTQSSKGRGELRKAVAKDIKDRAVSKAGEVASKAKAKAAGVAVDAAMAGSAAKKKAKETASAAKSAAKGAASSAKGAVKSAASGAKRGLKGLIRRGAEKVAGAADRVAKRMGEEFETYDVVVEFLCDYGIAEDLQEAQWLMVNEVDSEDIATILEAYGLDEGKSSRPLGYMHQFARGMKQKKGEKREKKYGVDSEGNPAGKYADMQHIKRANKREADLKAHRERQKQGTPFWMPEEVDIYDIILSHLFDEGYASTEEAAEEIMVNMSEEWRDDILAERFKRMDRSKISRQAKRLGGDRGEVLKMIAQKLDNEDERKYSTSQARKNRTQSGEYRQRKSIQAMDDAKADIKKHGLY